MKNVIYLFLLACIPFKIMAQLDRVEPPFWWSDMTLNEVEIMFYGQDIASAEIIAPKGIQITGITKTENPNYQFVTIATPEIAAGTYTFRIKWKEKEESYAYQFKERKPQSKWREGFDSSDMIYLLMPDRFANGNPNNDSIAETTEKADRENQGGRHGGDIEGIIDHLDYLENLGVTAIWSTPLCEDNDPAYSYHGYAQSDVYKIDPRYGSNEDYLKLADEMHDRDMKLIKDYVTNHWGAEHWMIKDLPTYDWVHQFPEYTNSNYRMTTQYDPNTSAIDKKYNEDGWFVKSMPDLNQSNPLVLNYLIQNAIWWIEYADLDGLRVDTYSYNEKEGISKWTKAIMDEYPNFNIVGEVWLHDSAQIAYWQKDSKIGAIQDFNSHLPSVMDFTLHDAIGMMFKESDGWDTGMMRAYENFVNDFLYPDVHNFLVFAENHDTQRINTVLNGNLDDYKLAMTLLATTRGIPQLYYGSEIGMQGDKGKGDGDIRQDFPGGWEDDPINAFKPKKQTKEQNAYYKFTSDLFQWRKNAKAVHSGRLLHYIPHGNIYVYFRILDEERVMVVLNNKKEAQELDLERFSEGLNDAQDGKDVISGKSVNLSGTLQIPAKTPMVIELE